MSNSVSAIRPAREYAPVRSFDDSADISQSELIGSSASFRAVLKRVKVVAPTDSAVLIQGETGTGKELIAKAIHDQSSRRHEPFVKMNCAAIPAELLESELFGHERGAFTGAVAQTMGRFQLAHKGTLFLDEIGDLPLQLQPKLLRVLQEQEFERLGSGRPIKVNVRVVTATNHELLKMVQDRQFRADLYYRLNVFPIRLPPLRDRSGDIPPLVRHFVRKYSQRLRRNIEYIPDEVVDALERYDWPGNIRELQNVVERAAILCEGDTFSIDETCLMWEIPQRSGPALPLVMTIADREREIIEEALAECGGQVAGPKGAAAKLGIPRQTLDSKIASLNIDKRRFKDSTRYSRLLEASSFVPATTGEGTTASCKDGLCTRCLLSLKFRHNELAELDRAGRKVTILDPSDS
jgi:formate hydrogenlyase transcriptional activator